VNALGYCLSTAVGAEQVPSCRWTNFATRFVPVQSLLQDYQPVKHMSEHYERDGMQVIYSPIILTNTRFRRRPSNSP
jgi:hypothetical protein